MLWVGDIISRITCSVSYKEIHYVLNDEVRILLRHIKVLQLQGRALLSGNGYVDAGADVTRCSTAA